MRQVVEKQLLSLFLRLVASEGVRLSLSERTHWRVDDWAFRREGPRFLNCDISFLCPGDEVFGNHDLLGLGQTFVIWVDGPLLLVLSGLEIALRMSLCFLVLLPYSVVGLYPLADLTCVRWVRGGAQVEVVYYVRDIRGYWACLVFPFFLDPGINKWFLVL